MTLRSLMDKKLRKAQDAAAQLELPLLGEIADFGATVDDAALLEVARAIRTNLRLGETEIKTLAVTGCSNGDGKSTLTAALACVLAQLGQRVLVMDCDFRAPAQYKNFKVENIGLASLAAGSEELEEKIQKTEESNLSVLAGGALVGNPADYLASERFAETLAKLKERYDYVVIDTPTALPLTDAAIVASQTDAVILNISSGTVDPEAAASAKARITQTGGKVVGMVMNKVEK